MATDPLRYNVRQALIAEIDRWLGKEFEDSMDKLPMRHVRDLLKIDMSPWQYIKKTRESHFIDECALIALRVRYSLLPEEKEFMKKKWLTDEGFYDTTP